MTQYQWSVKLPHTDRFTHTNYANKNSKEIIIKDTTRTISFTVTINKQLKEQIKTAFAEFKNPATGQQNQEFTFCTDISRAFRASVAKNIKDPVPLDDEKKFASYVISETLKHKPVSCCFSKPVQTKDHLHDNNVRDFIAQSMTYTCTPAPSTAP